MSFKETGLPDDNVGTVRKAYEYLEKFAPRDLDISLFVTPAKILVNEVKGANLSFDLLAAIFVIPLLQDSSKDAQSALSPYGFQLSQELLVVLSGEAEAILDPAVTLGILAIGIYDLECGAKEVFDLQTLQEIYDIYTARRPLLGTDEQSLENRFNRGLVAVKGAIALAPVIAPALEQIARSGGKGDKFGFN
jgi:soluble lytic murein transglycosylase-like protein